MEVKIKIDKKLKTDLDKLLDELGMDINTFFTLTAKQAVRDQELPFVPSLSVETDRELSPHELRMAMQKMNIGNNSSV